MALPSTTGGQRRYGLTNAGNGLRLALPTSPFDKLMIDPTFVASSSVKRHIPYDVFINHCGQDVKFTLASRIYDSLHATGLRVFLDKDELKLGDYFPGALEAAIRSSSIHIAIFSEHYAESPWCLAELDFMLQTGAKIIPIFYQVEPFTLRWAILGRGMFADALARFERKKRYTSELQRWKRALHQASFYTGDIVNKQIQGDEQRVVKNVVHRVMREMKKVPLEVAKHPVGLDEAVHEFDTIAHQSGGLIQLVGIWGMGGSGKTTLAKEIFNKRCSAMDRSSFLFDLRDAAGKGLLVEKQKKLLEDLDVKGVSFDSIHEGKGILKSRLRSISVLIILDDVDHADQLDALLPERETLGRGSLIVVTTRELDVLKASRISTVYEMRGLNHIHAKQLFCWHAFLRPSPLPQFEDLVEHFLSACNQLPLSLEVLGAQLYDKSDRDYWQCVLDKLSRILPRDINERLKISYDALDEEDKDMFLDTACFFIGQRKSVAIAVWDGSGWSGLLGWERLFNKCLIKVDKNDFIKMHDHLRDLGRDIANRQSPYRLWSPKQTIQNYPQEEAIQIRGMANAFGDNCYPCQGRIIIHTKQGTRSLAPSLIGLKIFVGDGDFITREYSELSRELICFQCKGFKHTNIPSWLSLGKLRSLELVNPQSIKELWGRDADAPVQLRELVIQSAYPSIISLRGFPASISCLKNLKKISVGQKYVDWNTLNCLPEELCDLQALEHLEIKWCRNLSSLPTNFGALINLRHLNLNDCINLKFLPDSFKNLTLLDSLCLKNCRELTIKSELHILEHMTKLRYLDLEGCKRLEELRLPEMASVLNLYLQGTSLKELPTNVFRQTRLTELVIGSDLLTTLPTSIGYLSSLTRLEIERCANLETLPGCVGNLSSLTTLKIEYCKKLKFLPDSLERLNSLRELYIDQSGVQCLPKSFIHLQSLTIRFSPFSGLSFGSRCMLQKIDLVGTKVSQVSISGDCCPVLETLSLSFNGHLRELETLPISLKTIDVMYCVVLKDIRGVRGLKNLRILKIFDCEELDGIPCFAELGSLEMFKLKGSKKVKKIAGLQELRSLRELSIEVDELPIFGKLASLKYLELEKCEKLDRLENFNHLTSLEKLNISDCPELEALPSLAEITTLKEFNLARCHKLNKIGGSECPKSLEMLKIDDCPKLEGLPNLAKLSSLKEFELHKSHKLERIEGLESLRALNILKITGCPELSWLPSLGHLTSLEEIELRMCPKLEKVEGLERLRSLEKLEVHTRWKAPLIARLEQCVRLNWVTVVADDKSVVRPFFTKTQNWPREVTICTKVDCDAGFKSFFEMPNAFVLDYSAMVESPAYGNFQLERPESSATANAILICFIIDCVYPTLHFHIGSGSGGHYFHTVLSEGKWVWMGVFTEASSWLPANRYPIWGIIENKVEVRVEEPWLVAGDKRSADVDATEKTGQTPLMHAVICNDKQVALLLVRHGADVDCEDNEGYTVLGRASNELRQTLIDAARLMLEG